MPKNKNSSTIVKRIVATLIDYFIVYILFILLSLIYLILSEAFKFKINSIELIVFIILWICFIVLLEYKFTFTLGKLIVGIRTISLGDNKKLTFIQILKRRILDPIDIFMLGIVSIIIIYNSENNQRFGNKFAKTTVVDKKHTLTL